MLAPTTYFEWSEILEIFGSGDDSVITDLWNGDFQLDAGTALRFTNLVNGTFEERKKQWFDKFNKSFSGKNLKNESDYQIIIKDAKANLIPLIKFSNIPCFHENIKKTLSDDLEKTLESVRNSLKDDIMKFNSNREPLLLAISNLKVDLSIIEENKKSIEVSTEEIITDKKIIIPDKSLNKDEVVEQETKYQQVEDKIQCVNCNAILNAKTKFCSECGSPIKIEKKDSQEDNKNVENKVIDDKTDIKQEKIETLNVNTKEIEAPILSVNDKDLKKNKKNRLLKIFLFSGITIFILAVACILYIYFINGTTKEEEQAYLSVKQSNTYNAYHDFIIKYPESNFKIEAQQLEDEALWSETKNTNTLEAYNKYIFGNTSGKYIKDAKNIREDLIWEEAKLNNSEYAYNKYLSDYPDGKYTNDAKNAIDNISNDIFKKDLFNKSIENYNLSQFEINSISVITSSNNGNSITYETNIDLTEIKTSQSFKAGILLTYSNVKKEKFTKFDYTYFVNASNNYFDNDTFLFLGRYRWSTNYAIYYSNGTWDGEWDNGEKHSGTWKICLDQLILYKDGQLMGLSKIINLNNSELTIKVGQQTVTANKLNN